MNNSKPCGLLLFSNHVQDDYTSLKSPSTTLSSAAPVLSAAPASAPAPAATSTDTVALAGIAEDISEFETKIKKLKVLRDNGILSDEEYEAEKKKLVSIF